MSPALGRNGQALPPHRALASAGSSSWGARPQHECSSSQKCSRWKLSALYTPHTNFSIKVRFISLLPLLLHYFQNSNFLLLAIHLNFYILETTAMNNYGKAM